jgi:hypothetical protein
MEDVNSGQDINTTQASMHKLDEEASNENANVICQENTPLGGAVNSEQVLSHSISVCSGAAAATPVSYVPQAIVTGPQSVSPSSFDEGNQSLHSLGLTEQDGVSQPRATDLSGSSANAHSHELQAVDTATADCRVPQFVGSAQGEVNLLGCDSVGAHSSHRAESAQDMMDGVVMAGSNEHLGDVKAAGGSEPSTSTGSGAATGFGSELVTLLNQLEVLVRGNTGEIRNGVLQVEQNLAYPPTPCCPQSLISLSILLPYSHEVNE